MQRTSMLESTRELLIWFKNIWNWTETPFSVEFQRFKYSQSHYLFVISNKVRGDIAPNSASPHPSQHWHWGLTKGSLKNTMEWKNAILASLKSLLKLCHSNESEISYTNCFERGIPAAPCFPTLILYKQTVLGRNTVRESHRMRAKPSQRSINRKHRGNIKIFSRMFELI